ncbi:MAG TPA: ATP-grasp domain-containing protein [Polyangiales bacterium]|nr:ATP-grasp domain-containing protein [Polyangiales bacterium]
MAPTIKRRRIIVLVHETLIPPEDISKLSPAEIAPFQTEFDVRESLRFLGHEVMVVGLGYELAPLRTAIEEFQPHVVFNLLEEFGGEAMFDTHVVGYLELQRTPYTGCNPRGLLLARDKALSKKVLTYHRIHVPRFKVFPRYRKISRPSRLEFPLIVKSLIEEGSYGIAQASVVYNDKALEERIAFIHEKIQTDAVVEQYIEGRELYVAVLGNHRLQVLPTWELFLDNVREDAPKIATRKVKWDLGYQEKYGVRIGRARKLPDEVQRRIGPLARRICRRLGTDGYVRIDFRLDESGELYFLEANPNPDIAEGEEFASAAQAAGIDYPALLQKIVNLGIRRAEHG